MHNGVTVYFTRRNQAEDVLGPSADGRGGYEFDSVVYTSDHRIARLKSDTYTFHIPTEHILLIRGSEETL